MREVGRNLAWTGHRLTRDDYRRRNGHDPRLLWFTGLSGSGKSTIAQRVGEELFRRGWYVFILDGDIVRQGLNRDLGFSEEDRRENIRRIGEVAKLFIDAGLVVLIAFISPFRMDRDRVRALLRPGEFVEVYVKCDLAVCEERDPKGLYGRARAGEISDFTGIDSPYEEPLAPELVLDTARQSVEESVRQVLIYLGIEGEDPRGEDSKGEE